ncbi:hypothetical protein [Streptomyces atratus]|uniref:hypothetical protein n=1 Tax=Streptomyces atratus TaxID=1893 RepID=UPI003658CD34
MNKKIAGAVALLAIIGGAFIYNSARADETDHWCSRTSWIRSASSTYYYLYRNNDHSRAEIAKSADYGGQLMTAYQASMDEGRLPHGIESDLKAWSLSLQEEIENGGTVATRTDGVLKNCTS